MTDWTWLNFDQLTNIQLYRVLQLREAIFTMGQQTTVADIDDVDLTATHLLGYQQQELIAYLRMYQKDNASYLGRIAVAKHYQGKGIGKEMMAESIQYLQKKYPNKPIKMSAQFYLESFYHGLGFVTISDVYKEAGIDHVLMILEKASGN